MIHIKKGKNGYGSGFRRVPGRIGQGKGLSVDLVRKWGKKTEHPVLVVFALKRAK
jgi:hypothetical protein